MPVAERHVCPSCRRLLPAGVQANECAFCELLHRQPGDDRCQCRRPVFARRYRGRWACRLCGGLSPAEGVGDADLQREVPVTGSAGALS